MSEAGADEMSDGALIVRFQGDPTGYRVDSHDSASLVVNKGWVEATIGATDRRVFINLERAYVVEASPD